MHKTLFFLLCLLAGMAHGKKAKPLAERSVEEILKEYVIIGDFTVKSHIRDNAKEIFWRYPVQLPKMSFPVKVTDINHKDIVLEFPQTEGSGRAVEHLNRGRILLLQGKFEEARNTFLGAKARYGTDYKFHRRADYFIANSFLYEAIELQKVRDNNMQDPEVRGLYVNASTFFSWAYGAKKHIPDPLLDRVAPKAYYNLTSIYYTYERWTAAYGAMEDGFDFLRRTGRKEMRADFRRIKAELYIRNRDYLSAVQQLDLSLRQNPTPQQGALVFARVADIYYDLNNFELAEDMYNLAIRLDNTRGAIRPWQYILRGECLFWIGKFEKSLKIMNYGMSTISSKLVSEDLPYDFQALASIRMADSYLALNKLDKAKLAYFNHEKEFRSHETKHVALLRSACLELPFYEGNNINHARKILDELKKAETLPIEVQELVWTCEMASYAQHDRDPSLIERVRRFYGRYPKSEFLASLIDPVREIQSRGIDQYFDSGDIYGAIDFYEKSKETLFPKVPQKYKKPLFEAYVDISYSKKSMPFYESYTADSDIEIVRKSVMLSEVVGEGKKWQTRNTNQGQNLENKKWNLKYSKEAHLFVDRILSSAGGSEHYLWLYNLSSSWVEDSFEIACDIVYPILQRIGENQEKTSKERFFSISKSFISSYLEDMLKYETFCAYSVLEFELEQYRGREKTLADLYLSRDFLPVNQVTAGLFYSLAELNYKQGNRNEARQLWQKISDNGDESLPEVRYAKSRLESRRTELDKLWE